MRGNNVLLAMIIFLSIGQGQDYNNIGPSLGVLIEDLGCDEAVDLAQFGSGMMEAARLETFRIDAINSEKETITNISVVAIMPKGLKYKDSSYLGGGALDESLEPNEFDETQNTKIKWKIGNLMAKENKSILLRIYFKCPVKETKIKLGVLGYKLNGTINDITDVPIVLKECNCSDKENGNLESPFKVNISVLNDPECNQLKELFSGRINNVRSDTFKIDVQNMGEISIDNLTVLAFIPKGMKYINSSYFNGGEDLKVSLRPSEFDEAQKTRIRWGLGTLRINETKSIILKTYVNCYINRTLIELAASGYSAGVFVNTSVNNDKIIILKDCNCTDEDLDTTLNRGNIYIGLRVYNPNKEIKETDLGAKNIIYNISVINTGFTRLENIAVVLELANGMIFKNASYSENWRGELSEVSEISGDKQKTKLIIRIGDLLPEERKSIILNTSLEETLDYPNIFDANIFAMVMGYSPESEKCEPIMDFAGTALNACNFVDEDGKPCEEWHRELGVCCVEACDDWVMPFLETSRPSINLSKNISKNITLNSSVYEANNSTKSVFGFGNSEAASLNIYNITLNNNQNTSLSNITLNITIPKDMIIKNTINSDNLNPNIDPAIFNRNSNTSLTWNIPNIMGNESKWFIFEAYLKKDTNINNTQIKINVEGYAPDYGCSPVKASLDGARPIKCLHINKFGNPCNDEDIKSKNCTELCPDWEIK